MDKRLELMGLLDRDYMKDAPRWHMGEGLETAPERKVVYITQPTVQKKAKDGSWFGALLILLLIGGVIWGSVSGKINWSAVGRMLSGNYGTHVCTIDNYDLNNVQCMNDAQEVDDLSQARLAISQHDDFVANSFNVILSKQLRDGTTSQVCTTSLDGAPGDNRVAWHLDEVIQQCGAHMQQGATYQIEVDQDTESVGTATFSYGLPQSASAPASALIANHRTSDHWTLVLCPAWSFDKNNLACIHTTAHLRHSELVASRFVLTGQGPHATIHGHMKYVVFRQDKHKHWYIQANVTEVVRTKGNYSVMAGYEGQVFHVGHAPPVQFGVPYKMTAYEDGHKLATMRFTIVQG